MTSIPDRMLRAAVARGRVPDVPDRIRRRRPPRRGARLGARVRRRTVPRVPADRDRVLRTGAPTPQSTCRSRVAQAGPVQIELIQQHCDRPSVYRELVGERRVAASTSCARDHVRLRRRRRRHYERLGYPLVSEMVVAGPARRLRRHRSTTSASTPSSSRTCPASSRAWTRVSRTCAEWDGVTDPVRILTRDGYRTPDASTPRSTVAAAWNMPPMAWVSDTSTPSTCAGASLRS